MSNLNGRKTKSLNDIPEVFKWRGHDEWKILLKVPFQENAASERSKVLNEERKDVFIVPVRKFEDVKQSNSEDEANEEEERLKKAEAEKISRIFKFDFLDVSLKKQKRILSVMDSFLSLVVITPMTISFWRGTWTFMDIHADMFPGLFTFILGLLVHVCFAILRNFLHERVLVVSKKKTYTSKILCKCMQILYTYVFGVSCNMYWRGAWIIFDHFFFHNIWMVVAATLMSVMILAIFRSVRNIIAIPSVIYIDTLTFVFWFPTRYKLNTRDWSLYLLDCAFSVGVVGTLVVFVWRGVWILFDLYLFSDDREYSAIGSLAIGYVIVTVTFSLQPLMRYACARLQGLARLIAADSFLLLSFLGTVNVWRGIWNVLDLWLVPDNQELSCWITHIGCFVFLVLLNCSNSILVRGVYIDAEEDDGKCVVFPCHYLRLFFKVEREKKEARRRNLLVASKDFRPRSDGNAKDAENGALLPNSTAATILPTNPESLV